MRSVITGLLSACVLLAFGSACASNGNKSNVSSVSGVLIDQSCGASMMKEANPEAAAAGHTKDCAMKPDCAASGYAVISGSQMLKFDDKGDQLAKDFLQKTTKMDNLRVNVQGYITGDSIAVTSLTPAS
jgi:hypothetical protein